MAIDFTKSKYSPKARKFLAKPTPDFKFFTLLDGSVRSSKTVNIIIKIPEIFHRIGNQYLKVFAGYSKNTVRNNLLVELFPYLKNYHGAKINYNSGSGELDIRLGNKIYNCLVVGGGKADSDSSIQGLTSDFIYINEIPKVHYSFYNMALSRLSPENAKLFADSNPESANHWLYKDKIKPFLDDDESAKQVFEYWHWTMADNYNLSKSYIANQEKLYTGSFYDRKIKGLWKVADGLVYDTFSEDKHVLPHADILQKFKNREFCKVIAGIDWGYTNPTAVTLFAVTRDNKYYLVDEFYKKQQTAENVIDWLNNKTQEYGFYKIEYIVGDAENPESNDKIQRAGSWVVRNDKPRVIDSISAMRSIINYDRLLVSDKCQNFINEITTYRYPSEDERLRRKGLDEDHPIKEFDHLMDSSRLILTWYEHKFCKNIIRTR